MKYDIDGSGEREYVASAYTMMLYEQTFGTSLVKDVYGVIDLTGGGTTEVVDAAFVKERLASALPEGKSLPKSTSDLVDKAFPAVVVKKFDYTRDNWEAYLKCMWTMAKTADKIDGKSGLDSYDKWLAKLGPVNLNGISNFVWRETQRGLFRTKDAGGASEGEE